VPDKYHEETEEQLLEKRRKISEGR
jgi:hypothetical protein